jgi:hypothetical protein
LSANFEEERTEKHEKIEQRFTDECGDCCVFVPCGSGSGGN